MTKTLKRTAIEDIDISSENIFNKQEAIELAGGNEDLANELFPMLINELPVYRENLLNAIQDNNIDELKKHIHKLHGGTKYCGVPALRIVSSNFEDIVDLKEQDKFQSGLNEVITAIDQLLEYYETHYT